MKTKPTNVLLDICPEINETTGKWEIRETDEKDNALEVHEFETEELALKFTDGWVRCLEVCKGPETAFVVSYDDKYGPQQKIVVSDEEPDDETLENLVDTDEYEIEEVPVVYL